MKNFDTHQRCYTPITDHAALRQTCAQLENESWLAVDTEFVRVDTYYPELSLVQIATANRDFYLIDPLALLAEKEHNPGITQPLMPLMTLLQNPNVLKVFHSARQDVEVLFQLQHQMPAALFDTQIAAIFLRHGDLAGFARVIEAELGISLDKSQTRTNWHARPLSAEQIAYAIDDVDYLVRLYQHLTAQLSEAQKQAVLQDSAKLLQPELYQTQPDQAWLKIKGLKRLKPKQLAMVQSLAAWREQHAIEHNQPKKWTLSDDALLEIVKRPPRTVAALYKVPGIKSSSVRDFGEDWIARIDCVFSAEPESYPQLPPALPEPNPQELALLDACHAFCQQVSLDYAVPIQNMVSRDELLCLIREPHRAPWQGWRHHLLGKPLQTWLLGQSTLCVQAQRLQFDTPSR
ncbi:MAG: ribonuclease D [Thiotrichales bacterium]|nr:ribonuclease D [Thiotrichales bacterium]